MRKIIHHIGVTFLFFLIMSLGTPAAKSEEGWLKDPKARMSEVDKRLVQEASEKQREKKKLEKESARQEKERLKKLKKQVYPIYREAIRLYNAGELEAAQDQFKQVEWILPDYRETEKYLTRLQKDLQEKPKLTQQRQELKRLQALYEKAGGLYETAKQLYAVKSYEEAKIQFMEVESVYSDFKLTREYLRKIQRTIQKQRDEEQKKEVSAFKKNLRREKLIQQAEEERAAIAKYKEEEEPLRVKSVEKEVLKQPSVSKETPKHVEVSKPKPQRLRPVDLEKERLARAKAEEKQKQKDKKRLRKELEKQHREDIKDRGKKAEQEENLKKEQAGIQRDFENRLQLLYLRAVNLYQLSFYQEAQELFVEIDKMQSSYQQTQQYLAKIKDTLTDQPRATKSLKRKIDQTLDVIEQKM